MRTTDTATTPAPAADAPRPALDPAIAEMERRWKASGIPGLYDGGNGPVSRERARNVRSLLYPKPELPTGRIDRRSITGADGQVIDVRIVFPHPNPHAPSDSAGPTTGTLVYFHGGGWIVGDVDSHEAHAIRLANRAGVVVVNVEYRLAPEHPFPQGFEDCLAATLWAEAHRAELGGAGRPLAVGGDSAGGNFAAAVALHCRDAGIKLDAQLLIYPATDLSHLRDPLILAAYFGTEGARLGRDLRASPRLAPSLAGLAPAIIGVGPYDFLYQDNLAYAQALREAGVPLLMRIYPTLNHGFFSYTAISKDSEAAANELCDDLRALLLSV